MTHSLHELEKVLIGLIENWDVLNDQDKLTIVKYNLEEIKILKDEYE